MSSGIMFSTCLSICPFLLFHYILFPFIIEVEKVSVFCARSSWQDSVHDKINRETLMFILISVLDKTLKLILTKKSSLES